MNELIIFTIMMIVFSIGASIFEHYERKNSKKRQRQRIKREMQRQLRFIENEEEVMGFVKNCSYGGSK